MKCDKCSSNRVVSISGKTSDCFSLSYRGLDYDGYVPSDIGIGGYGGDYIELSYCLDCGKIQGAFPITVEAIEQVFERAK